MFKNSRLTRILIPLDPFLNKAFRYTIVWTTCNEIERTQMEDNNLFYCSSKDTTPMMAQYIEAKSQYPGCLLFFRMGDFYELFFDDAKVASSALNIALTTRGKHLDEDIPMCGVPIASVDTYLGRLVKSGYKVAICEQMESPEEARKRGYKAIVKREITRIVTPGTIVEDSLLTLRENNFLMAVVPEMVKKTGQVKTVSFAAIDISTGDFFVNSVIPNEFSAVMEMYQPKEILVPAKLEKSDFLKSLDQLKNNSAALTVLPDSKFNPVVEADRLKKYFNIATLDSLEISISSELSACGAVLEYLLITQRGSLSVLPLPKKTSFNEYLIIDSATSKSLEIISSLSGEYAYSLLGALDKTVTPFGARALAARISTPIVSIDNIEKRLDCVEFFVQNDKLSKLIRDLLDKCPDFERAMNRIKFNKFSAKDVGDIREFTRTMEALKVVIKDAEIPSEGEFVLAKVADFSELQKLLESALVDVLPSSNSANSEVIAEGYSKKLDELKYTKNHSEELISNLQAEYIGRTGINTLKIRNNAILGWYIEIPLAQRIKIASDFVHRQTLVNSVRYTTEKLMKLQAKLSDAFEEWMQMERKIYADIVSKIYDRHADILYAIKFLACIDVYTTFATIASERNYVRPEISADPVLEVKDGRHPVLELYEKDFTDNDSDLDSSHRVCLLTGPNMAGKSTYLRQNALIIIMAQVGCFVPAAKAKIGIVDRLFSRIGASDDIARGRSTFMVEMIETATILNQATSKSFVILDEVGRGTSTYDGLSIAWAVIENLYKVNKCRVLFATHYRELSSLQDSLKNIRCKTLKVQEWNGDVIFYHKIIDGVSDKSYGIHVASIAGIPKQVIRRAAELLKKLEDKESGEPLKIPYDLFSEQLDLQIEPVKNDQIREKIAGVDLNSTTPKAALDILYELKGML